MREARGDYASLRDACISFSIRNESRFPVKQQSVLIVEEMCLLQYRNKQIPFRLS